MEYVISITMMQRDKLIMHIEDMIIMFGYEGALCSLNYSITGCFDDFQIVGTEDYEYLIIYCIFENADTFSNYDVEKELIIKLKPVLKKYKRYFKKMRDNISIKERIEKNQDHAGK